MKLTDLYIWLIIHSIFTGYGLAGAFLFLDKSILIRFFLLIAGICNACFALNLKERILKITNGSQDD